MMKLEKSATANTLARTRAAGKSEARLAYPKRTSMPTHSLEYGGGTLAMFIQLIS